MQYKDERIKMAMANVSQKQNVVNEAKKALYEAQKEAAKTVQEVFTEKVAKPGEIIRDKTNGKVFYFDHIEADAYGSIEVVCYPQKKDGTPSRSIRKMWVSAFAEL